MEEKRLVKEGDVLIADERFGKHKPGSLLVVIEINQGKICEPSDAYMVCKRLTKNKNGKWKIKGNVFFFRMIPDPQFAGFAIDLDPVLDANEEPKRKFILDEIESSFHNQDEEEAETLIKLLEKHDDKTFKTKRSNTLTLKERFEILKKKFS
jgi:hypothetical protein